MAVVDGPLDLDMLNFVYLCNILVESKVMK